MASIIVTALGSVYRNLVAPWIWYAIAAMAVVCWLASAEKPAMALTPGEAFGQKWAAAQAEVDRQHVLTPDEYKAHKAKRCTALAMRHALANSRAAESSARGIYREECE